MNQLHLHGVGHVSDRVLRAKTIIRPPVKDSLGEVVLSAVQRSLTHCWLRRAGVGHEESGCVASVDQLAGVMVDLVIGGEGDGLLMIFKHNICCMKVNWGLILQPTAWMIS